MTGGSGGSTRSYRTNRTNQIRERMQLSDKQNNSKQNMYSKLRGEQNMRS